MSEQDAERSKSIVARIMSATMDGWGDEPGRYVFFEPLADGRLRIKIEEHSGVGARPLAEVTIARHRLRRLAAALGDISKEPWP